MTERYIEHPIIMNHETRDRFSSTNLFRIGTNAQLATVDLTVENISVQICAVADELVAKARK